MYPLAKHSTPWIGVMTVMSSCTTALAQTATEVPERSTIDDAHKWDLSIMYDSAESWDRDHGMVSALIEGLAGLKGTCARSDDALSKALALRDRIDIHLEKLYAYASMRFHEDMRLSDTQALEQRAKTLAAKYEEA